MRFILPALLVAASSIAPAVAYAEPAAAVSKTKAPYSVQETDLGTLLDDPVAKAILLKYIPDVVNNPQIEMGRSMTLEQLQQYAGDQLTPEKLEKIKTDLASAKP